MRISKSQQPLDNKIFSLTTVFLYTNWFSVPIKKLDLKLKFLSISDFNQGKVNHMISPIDVEDADVCTFLVTWHGTPRPCLSTSKWPPHKHLKASNKIIIYIYIYIYIYTRTAEQMYVRHTFHLITMASYVWWHTSSHLSHNQDDWAKVPNFSFQICNSKETIFASF